MPTFSKWQNVFILSSPPPRFLLSTSLPRSVPIDLYCFHWHLPCLWAVNVGSWMLHCLPFEFLFPGQIKPWRGSGAGATTVGSAAISISLGACGTAHKTWWHYFIAADNSICVWVELCWSVSFISALPMYAVIYVVWYMWFFKIYG